MNEPQKAITNSHNSGIVALFKRFENFGVLSLAKVFSNISFVAFLVILAVVHIANSHLAERWIRDISKKEKEVQQLRWYYMTQSTTLTQKTKQSEVEQLVSAQGLKPLHQPPFKLENK